MGSRDNVLELFKNDSSGWRQRVADGIEKNRKGDARIHLTYDGKPICNATVKAIQKDHEFRFGANCFMLDGIETKEKTELYKKYFAELFNMATLPFYWDALEPRESAPRFDKDSPFCYRRPPIDTCMEFCEQNGIEPREHGLAYDRFFPSWLYGASVDRVKQAYEERCRRIAERYAHRIPTIEVTNEMEWESGMTAFYDQSDFVEFCFKTARKYFPNNQLGINDHTGLAWQDRCRATDKYYSYIEANMLKGTPIDAIGMQFHMFDSPQDEYRATRTHYDPDNLLRHMDLYAGLGKPLQITEITIPAYSSQEYDESIQAEIISQLYPIWFSHPAAEQIIYWNFADGYAHVWTDDLEKIRRSQGDMTQGENVYYGGLLRFDMTPKPAYNVLKHLIKEEWHTEATLTTDGEGNASFRGFYGNYTLEIEHDGSHFTREISLSKGCDGEIKIAI